MDSVLIAHVAEAITAITGDDDYDAVADRAAGMLEQSWVLRTAAAGYRDGAVSGAGLRAAVLGMLHREAGETPHDVDSDDSPLMDAIGETSPTTAVNADDRLRAVDAYRAALGE